MEEAKLLVRQFPVGQIQSTIEKFLVDKAKVQSKLSEHQNIVTFPMSEVDSLTMVELLIELEPVVEHKLPVSLIKPGGYESGKQVQDELLPKLEEIWRKKAE